MLNDNNFNITLIGKSIKTVITSQSLKLFHKILF